MRFKDWFLEGSAYLLALLFFYTALSKLIDFNRFVWEIGNQPFEPWLKQMLIYGLPTIELLATFLLLRLRTRQFGLYLSLVLMVIFTIYIALVTLNYFNRVPCSCAGVFHEMSWPQHLVFNTTFILISMSGIFLNRTIGPKTTRHKQK